MLYGLYRPDEGEIHIDGKRRIPLARRGDPRRHRHDPPALHARAEPDRRGERGAGAEVVARAPARPRRGIGPASGAVPGYGLKVDPSATVWQLSVGEQQRVEILKALYRGASLIILDEPTAVLTPQEVNDLFATLAHGGRRPRPGLYLPQAARSDGDQRPRDGAARRTHDRHKTYQ